MGDGIWKETQLGGINAIVGENEFIRVTILPSRGGKIISFINKETGKDWVYQSGKPWKPLVYGMSWDDGDRSGWDEMFPTILSCPCPDEPWRHAAYPDHGEVWSLPWSAEIEGERLRMQVHGVQVPYVLGKTYSLSARCLATAYDLHNPTPFPFSYLWCAHNLLSIKEGMKLVIDPNLTTVQYQHSGGHRLSPRTYDRTAYPAARNGDTCVDLSVIEPNLGKHSEKYWFEQEQTEGRAGIVDPDSGDRLIYRYSPEDVPYLAVWANYGSFGGDYTFALEPSTGYLDDVYVANLMQRVKKVAPYSVNKWDFAISVE